MGALEQNLENFLDNNTPGGYIQTNVSISNNEIEALITEKINNRGFITNAQETDPTVPNWAKQPNPPTPAQIGAMPNNGVSISNVLGAGEGRSRIATITINGNSTDIYQTNVSGGSTTLTEETDPIFSASPAAGITLTDINNWNAGNAFSGNYTELTNIPSILTAITNSIDDIEEIALTSSSLSFHIIDVTEYNLNNFGENSLYVSNGRLISDIINFLQQNYMVILKNDAIQWMVNSYSQYNTDTYMIELRQINSNYFYLLQNLPDREDNETEIDYNNRCNQYILNNIIMTRRYILLIRDENGNEFYIVKAGVSN